MKTTIGERQILIFIARNPAHKIHSMVDSEITVFVGSVLPDPAIEIFHDMKPSAVCP